MQFGTKIFILETVLLSLTEGENQTDAAVQNIFMYVRANIFSPIVE